MILAASDFAFEDVSAKGELDFAFRPRAWSKGKARRTTNRGQSHGTKLRLRGLGVGIDGFDGRPRRNARTQDAKVR